MAVAGDPEHRHGIILAKNVPAKRKGVRTAETIGEALKKCPELTILKPDYDSYVYFSEKVRQLYYEYTDRIEPFGIDECWLDISGSVSYFGSVEKIVGELLNRVKNEIGLTLSIGVSFNRVYAKLGSDLAKEDSSCYIGSLDDIKDLPAGSLLGVGYSTGEKLKSYGLYTIGDVAKRPLPYLKEILGKWGESLYCCANGIESSPIPVYREQTEEVKSIGNSMTSIRDLQNMEDFKIVLSVLCDSVSARVRAKKMYFRTVHLQVRTRKLEVRTMQMRLKENSDLGKDIFNCAVALFEKNCDFSIPYRSIGVSVSSLSFQKDLFQTSLFEKGGYSLKQKKEETAIDTIRERFGRHAISSLRILEDAGLSSFIPKAEKEIA